MHSLRYSKLPSSFHSLLELKTDVLTDVGRHDTGNFFIPINNIPIKFPLLESAKDWNSLPLYYKNITKIKEFKKGIKEMLLDRYESE